jgi:septum site-determining protein MinC
MIQKINEETPSVRIKGVGDSIWVTIAPNTPFQHVQDELGRLFEPLKHLANTTQVVLDTGAGPANADCRRHTRNFLKKRFNISKIITSQEKQTGEEKPFRMKKTRSAIPKHHRDTLVLAGRIRSGQNVQAKKHLIIMGDVNPGCQLTAGGDILVLGSLLGTAAAGQPDNADAIILALDFRPTQIKIAEVVAAGLPAASQETPEYAHLESGGIVVDDYLEVNPFNRIPWPVIR